MDRRPLVAMTAILLLSFALNIVVLFQLEANLIHFYEPLPEDDPAYYMNWGEQIVAGEWPNDNPFDLSPYYPYYLALIYKFLGRDMIMPRLFQVLLGLLVVALTYRIGKALFSTRIGLVSAFVLSVYGPFLYYNIEFSTAPHNALWVTLAIYLIILYARRGHWSYALVAGVFVGFAALGQPNAVVFAGALALWLLLIKIPRSVQVRGIVALGLGTLAVVALPTWHNYRVTDRLGFITMLGPYNLYIGNNPEAIGKFYSIGREVRTHIEESGETTYRAEIWDFYTSQPAEAIGLLGKKATFFLVGSDAELGSYVNYHFWGVENSFILKLLLLRYEMLALIVLIGSRLVINRQSAILLLCFVVYGLSIIAVFVQARYRIPLVPIMIILSTAAVFAIIRRFRSGDKAVLLLVVGFIVAMIALQIRYELVLLDARQSVIDELGDETIETEDSQQPDDQSSDP